MTNNSTSFSVPRNTLNNPSGLSCGVFAIKLFLHVMENKGNHVIEIQENKRDWRKPNGALMRSVATLAK